jgi:hypothetical protein
MQMTSSKKEEKMRMGAPRETYSVGGSNDPQRGVGHLESYEKKTVLVLLAGGVACGGKAAP